MAADDIQSRICQAVIPKQSQNHEASPERHLGEVGGPSPARRFGGAADDMLPSRRVDDGLLRLDANQAKYEEERSQHEDTNYPAVSL
jgi:hypothetical protein